MPINDTLGWFNDWPIFFWIVLLFFVYIFLYSRKSDIVSGRKPALLFYTISFFALIDVTKRIGNAINAPLPVTVLMAGMYALGYYYILKKDKS